MERSPSSEAFNTAFDAHLPPYSADYDSKPEIERYKERAARDENVLRRFGLLTAAFQIRKNAVLKEIRSTDTKNLPSVTIEDITRGITAFEEKVARDPRLRSSFQGFFVSGKPEAVLVNGNYHLVGTKEQFFDLLAKEIHTELFAQPELFTNVAGIFATRLDPREDVAVRKTEVLLVKNKNGLWHFPGGKAAYVALHPETGTMQLVEKDGEGWKFSDGTAATEVRLETPEECIVREVKEEIDVDIDSVTLDSSGFYTMGSKRFLIHGFVVNDMFTADALSKVGKHSIDESEIMDVEWSNNPFVYKDGTKRPLTPQADAILTRIFPVDTFPHSFVDEKGSSLFGTPQENS